MKKIILTIFVLTLLFNYVSYGQATSAGNVNAPTGPGFEYLGWTTGTNRSLIIGNEDNQQLHFYTNGGAGFTNNLKMRVGRRVRNGSELGSVMIQNSGTTNILNPRAILHLGHDYSYSVNGGWKGWMDIGTFATSASDFTYIGFNAGTW